MSKFAAPIHELKSRAASTTPASQSDKEELKEMRKEMVELKQEVAVLKAKVK